MKKVKELSCFVIPIFAILAWLYFLFPNNEFVSRENYLRLYSKDELWLKAMLCSLVVAFVVGTIAFLLKSKFSRKFNIKRTFFYLGTVIVVSIPVFLSTIVGRIIAASDPHVMLRSYTPPYASEYEILGSILFAVFVTFIIWIIENITEAVKADRK